MERDWYRRLMLKLAEVRDTGSASEFLTILDSELDDLGIQLDGYRRGGIFSGFTLKRGLNLLADLRGKLEICRNGSEVRHVFLEVDDLRNLVDESLEAAEERANDKK